MCAAAAALLHADCTRLHLIAPDCIVDMGNVRRRRRARLLGALRSPEGPLMTSDDV